MAARATVQGLSTADLDQIRNAVASGRKPKVVFTEAAGQIAGQLGQVIELRDSATTDEWIVVRFGRDELPFSPSDLAIPPRAAPARRTEPKSQVVTVPAPREQPKATGQPKPVEQPTVARPAKAAKAKPPASLTVTLSYTDREWTVSANQGTKALARPYVIKPAEALQMVSLVDVPAVHEAVENIIAAERADAETRAERLRAELAEIESRLSELTARS